MSVEETQEGKTKPSLRERIGTMHFIIVILCVLAIIAGIVAVVGGYWLAEQGQGGGNFRAPLGALIFLGGIATVFVMSLITWGLIKSQTAKTKFRRSIFRGLVIATVVFTILSSMVAINRYGPIIYIQYRSYIIAAAISVIQEQRLEEAREGADAGEPWGQVDLGRNIYRKWQYGTGPDVYDYCLEAMEWFKRAAYQNYAPGQKWVATSYQHCVPALPENKTHYTYLWHKITLNYPDAHWEYITDAERYFSQNSERALEILGAEGIAEVEALAAQIREILDDPALTPAERELASETIITDTLGELTYFEDEE